MTDNAVRFDLLVQCLQDNSAPEPYEWSMQQTIYLTSHFNTRPVRVTLKEGEPATPITLTGTLPAEARMQIPATAAIGFACTVFHQSGSEIPCRVESGTSHILVSELRSAIATGRPFSKDVHIQAHTVADKYEKAVLRVSLRQAAIASSLQFAPMSINANVAGQELQQLLQLTYTKEMSMGNTIPGTENIRCFLDISEAGIQLTGSYVPALAYIHGQIPVSNELFWTNALQNVLEREQSNINWFMTCKDKNEQARISFLLLDYPVTILPYISDEIDRRTRRPSTSISTALRGKQGKEQFSNLFALLAGDCEDKARGGNITRRALKKFISSTASAAKTLPMKALHHIDALLDQYVIMMSLCVVHGAKAGDSATMPVGAHMANVGMPVHYFKKCLERTNDGKQLASRLPWPKNIEKGYETQMLEGTGMLDPRGYKDSKAHVRQYVRQGTTVRKLAHPMIMEHGKDNPFFLGALQGWTTYFTDRGASKGMGGFWFAHATDGTRGSLYTDVTSERQCVALRPMPEAPTSVQRLMIEANTFDMPPRPLVLSRIENDMGNRLLDKLCDQVNALNRSTPTAEKQRCSVMVHLMSHQLNKHVADGLYTDVRDSLKRVYHVDYKREAVTDDFHGYRLVTYVKTDNK